MIIFAAFILTLSVVACLYRVLKGPTIPDRMAAIDVIGLLLAMVMVLLASYYNFTLFFDIVLVYSALLFVDVMIMAKYLEYKGLYR